MKLNATICLLILLSMAPTSGKLKAAPGKTGKTVSIVVAPAANPRIVFGAERVSTALAGAGYTVKILKQLKVPSGSGYISIGVSGDPLVSTASQPASANGKPLGKEGFTIQAVNGNILIRGTDFSGALYGCVELADRIKQTKEIPQNLSFSDQPEMVLRGACIGVQKPTYLPGRGVYEYPYT